ncbi:hypothetical protein [Veillonella magna]|uniref:hypothetical protein n=1 Tax=Veillonella magna TaxID=464322 RepID=UPI000413EF00|nr:hypothetical protein [Veillonella magna]
MNYIKQINGFQKWILVHPGVSSSARFLWLTLLHYNNVAGWKKNFNLSMNALLLSTGLCERTIRNARNELCSLGLLMYKKGRVGIAPIYQLIPVEEFDKPDDLPIDETTTDEVTTGQMKEGKTATDVTITEPVISAGDNEEVPQAEVELEDIANNKDEINIASEPIKASENDGKHTANTELETAKFTGNDDEKIGNTKHIPATVPAILPAKVRVKSYETFVPILKLNETRLNISKESTKKGSEAILVEPQDNTLKNAEEDVSNVTLQSKSVSTIELQSNAMITSKETSKSTAESTAKSNKADEEEPFVPPTLEMVQAYCREKGYHIDPEAFMAYYDAVGWSVGKKTMKSWKRAAAYWERNEKKWKAEAKERRGPIAHKGTVLVHKGMALVLRDMLTAMITETAPQITAERENPQPTEEQAAPDASITTWQESG